MKMLPAKRSKRLQKVNPLCLWNICILKMSKRKDIIQMNLFFPSALKPEEITRVCSLHEEQIKENQLCYNKRGTLPNLP